MERALLFDLDKFLKNFLQDITNGKVAGTARPHGQVGFNALLSTIMKIQHDSEINFRFAKLSI